ncbi:MAG: SPOR domain-containing protein [Succinivibrio sp.]
MTFSKNLRNRIVGILVITSVILICIPVISNQKEGIRESDQADNAKAIAIDHNGALTDENGKLVTADTANESADTDYSDLLNPVNDVEPTAPAAESPFNNSQKAAQAPKTETLKTAVINDATPSNNTEVLKPNTSRTETLTPKKETAKATPSNNTVSAALVSGKYAAQVGVFSKKSNANGVIEELKAKGFKPVAQHITVNGKAVVRVFAATCNDRDEATKICNRVKASLKNIQCSVKGL